MPKLRKPIGERGQTLIETALVLPLLGLYAMGMVWLICFCWNSVVLQKMALNKVRDVSADPSVFVNLTSLKMWGHSTRAVTLPLTSAASPWRPFIPLPYCKVHDVHGSFKKVTCKSFLTGGRGFTRWWTPKWQQADAETLIEARIPRES